MKTQQLKASSSGVSVAVCKSTNSQEQRDVPCMGQQGLMLVVAPCSLLPPALACTEVPKVTPWSFPASYFAQVLRTALGGQPFSSAIRIFSALPLLPSTPTPEYISVACSPSSSSSAFLWPTSQFPWSCFRVFLLPVVGPLRHCGG